MYHHFKNIAILTVSCLLLLGCGGESKDSLPSLYSIGGTVVGLGKNKTVALENYNTDELIISADGKFTFPENFYLTYRYNVSIKTQPHGQKCRVFNESGNLSGGNVSNILVKCVTSGSLDTKLDTDGIFVHHGAAGGNGDDEGNSLALDTGGGIWVTGYSLNAKGNKDMVMWRYDPNGSYYFLGHNDAAGGNGDDVGNSLAINAAGEILVAGYSLNSSNNEDMVIWRAYPDGTLDTSFDDDGIVIHDNDAGGSADDVGLSMAEDANGKILVAGYSQKVSGDSDMVIWRYNTKDATDGKLDTSFGAKGIVVHNGAAGRDDVA